MKIKRFPHHVDVSSVVAHIVLIIGVILMLFPVFFAVGASFKPQSEIYSKVLQFFSRNPTLSNYITAFSMFDYADTVKNTLIIATCVMAFKVITSFLCAYAFVFLRFPGKNAIYFILIVTMFIPFTVTMVPNYVTVAKIGLRDNIFGVMLPQLSDAMGILLLRQQMKGIPISLFEVARIEKTSHFSIMTKIILPIVKPGVVSIATMFFVNSWNEYVWPRLIIKSQENYTLSLALQLFIDAESGSGIGTAMAMCTATMMIPLILFIIFQKQIMGTYASSGIKG